MKDFACIILAAGNGSRFGSKKQFEKLNGEELWKIVFEKCSNVSTEIVVVGVDIEGGNTRQESVFAGLQKIKSGRVVILEAARPLVTEEQIIQIAQIDGPSVSFYKNLVDTVYSNDYGFLIRDKCVSLQTPQAFDAKMIFSAHQETALKNATDDTVIFFEKHKIKPDLIYGGDNLTKVTYPIDIFLLESLCKKNWF